MAYKDFDYVYNPETKHFDPVPKVKPIREEGEYEGPIGCFGRYMYDFNDYERLKEKDKED